MLYMIDNERIYMKKIIAISLVVSFIAVSAPAFAANSAGQIPKTTIFNRLSGFFSTFDRPFTRPGNKQGFWQSTADWVKNINKE